MAVPMTLLASLLMLSSVQASDIADGATGKFMAYHVTPAVDSRISSRTDSEIQKMADKEEDKDVQKLLNSESNMPIGLSAIGFALLSLAAVVGVRMRRGMQPAIASSGGHGIDMSIPLATVSGDNTLELKSQRPALAQPNFKSPFALFDPLGLGRESELQHGRMALTAVYFLSPQKANSTTARSAEDTYWEGEAPPSYVLGNLQNAPSGLLGPASGIFLAIGLYCVSASQIASPLTAATVNPAYVAGSLCVPVSWGLHVAAWIQKKNGM